MAVRLCCVVCEAVFVCIRGGGGGGITWEEG
jgi:hypothetical protein